MFYNILAKILKSLAIPIVRRYEPKVIAITGSAGKTSAKEAIYLVLKQKFGNSVKKSSGNLNNELGIPLAILGYTSAPAGWQWPFLLPYLLLKFLYIEVFGKYPKILVLEYAADKPGDIKYLTDIARPQISVITSIGPAHLEKFKTLDNVIKEKISLAQNMEPEGIAVLNIDNEYIRKSAQKIFYQKIFYYGGNLNSAANAALAVGEIFHISKEKMEKILADFKLPLGRGGIIETSNKNIIIDDSYNANPISVKMAIEKLNNLFREYQNKTKIICLGDMRELGNESQKLHREIYKLAQKNSKHVYTVGREFAEVSKGINNFSDSEELARFLLTKAIKESIILVKGSHAMEMQKIVKIFKDNYAGITKS